MVAAPPDAGPGRAQLHADSKRCWLRRDVKAQGREAGSLVPMDTPTVAEMQKLVSRRSCVGTRWWKRLRSRERSSGSGSARSTARVFAARRLPEQSARFPTC